MLQRFCATVLFTENGAYEDVQLLLKGHREPFVHKRKKYDSIIRKYVMDLLNYRLDIPQQGLQEPNLSQDPCHATQIKDLPTKKPTFFANFTG